MFLYLCSECKLRASSCNCCLLPSRMVSEIFLKKLPTSSQLANDLLAYTILHFHFSLCLLSVLVVASAAIAMSLLIFSASQLHFSASQLVDSRPLKQLVVKKLFSPPKNNDWNSIILSKKLIVQTTSKPKTFPSFLSALKLSLTPTYPECIDFHMIENCNG